MSFRVGAVVPRVTEPGVGVDVIAGLAGVTLVRSFVALLSTAVVPVEVGV